MRPVKSLAVSGVLLAALATGCGGSSSPSSTSSPTPKGTPFSSPEWHFSMNFPKAPQQTPLNQAVEGVTINGRVFSTDTVAVSVVQLPENQEINVTGAASGTKGTITEQHAETFQGRPAREGSLMVKGQPTFVEAFVDGHRLYGITATPQDSFDAAKASFMFLP
jgi:hypothetical protein